MSDFEQKIAKVRRAYIGFEDHGFLTVTLDFDYGGAGQGLGSRAFGLDSEKPADRDKWRDGHAMGMDCIRRLLLACGVESWDRIVGRTVLVTANWTEITRIDPLPTETGTPFDIREWVDSYAEAVA